MSFIRELGIGPLAFPVETAAGEIIVQQTSGVIHVLREVGGKILAVKKYSDDYEETGPDIFEGRSFVYRRGIMRVRWQPDPAVHIVTNR